MNETLKIWNTTAHGMITKVHRFKTFVIYGVCDFIVSSGDWWLTLRTAPVSLLGMTRFSDATVLYFHSLWHTSSMLVHWPQFIMSTTILEINACSWLDYLQLAVCSHTSIYCWEPAWSSCCMVIGSIEVMGHEQPHQGTLIRLLQESWLPNFLALRLLLLLFSSKFQVCVSKTEFTIFIHFLL